MKSRHLRTLLGLVFLVLGGWVLLFPGPVETLVLTPDHVIGALTSRVLLACFGAQAVLCGTVILASHFTARTFLIFGLVGSLPFFVGNFGILTCGIWGWILKRREGNDELQSAS